MIELLVIVSFIIAFVIACWISIRYFNMSPDDYSIVGIACIIFLVVFAVLFMGYYVMYPEQYIDYMAYKQARQQYEYMMMLKSQQHAMEMEQEIARIAEQIKQTQK